MKPLLLPKKNDGPGSRVANHFDEIDILDINKIKEYIKKNKIEIIYSTGSDLAMPVVEKVSEDLNLPHFNNFETAKICNQKDLMRSKLGNSFKGNIPYQILEEMDEVTLPFPFIMKPTDSQGQRGVFIVNNMEEFRNNFKISKKFSRKSSVILEKYIDGPEVSVNGYLKDGELLLSIVSDRETWEDYVGLIKEHILPSKEVNEELEDKIHDLIQRAAHKLNIINGPIYAQIKLSNNEPYIIEVTPRLDGCHMWKLIQKASNINLIKLLIQHLDNNNISELANLNPSLEPCKLSFFCTAPNKNFDLSEFDVPEDYDEIYWYYKNDEFIRPINGKKDKVGYFIK